MIGLLMNRHGSNCDAVNPCLMRRWEIAIVSCMQFVLHADLILFAVNLRDFDR